MRSITFRNAILGSFLIFIAIIVLIALQVLFIHNEEEKLRSLEASIKKISDTNLLIYKAQQDFLSNELINPAFYKTGNSTHLAALKQYIGENTNLITKGTKDGSLIKFGIDTLSWELNKAVLKQYDIFSTLVATQKVRGFKDYGTEGQMRMYIHELESSFPEIDKLLLLTIRRAEKDYLLRKEKIYKRKMRELYKKLIHSDGANGKRKKEIRLIFDRYYQCFTRLTELEQKIGVNNNTGLRAELIRSFEISERLLNQMLVKAQINSRQQTNTLFTILHWSMIFSVALSIVIAFVLSRLITKQIETLSATMVEASNNQFSIIPDLKTRSSILEVSILEDKFIHLMHDISRNLEVINSKSQKLEEYNTELEAINDLMSETNKKLRKSEASLLKSISVKEKFLAIISHDVRSPLATLKGYLNIMTVYPEMITEDQKLKTLTDLRNSVDLQLNLLSNMIEWARSQMSEIKVSPEIISVYEISLNTSKLLAQTALAKKIKIENNIKDYALLADRNMLELVFRNLISNAIKFTHQEGFVNLSSELMDSETVRIVIRDNGIGISPENLRSILKTDDHFTNDGTNNEKGTGFGLLFCKEFVERNGGTMFIESEYGQGTQVSFTVKRIRQERINFQAILPSKKHKMLS